LASCRPTCGVRGFDVGVNDGAPPRLCVRICSQRLMVATLLLRAWLARLTSLARLIAFVPWLASTIVEVGKDERRAFGEVIIVGWRSDLDRINAVPDGFRVPCSSLLSSPVSASIVLLVELRVFRTPVNAGPLF